jgi:hypothetical protein
LRWFFVLENTGEKMRHQKEYYFRIGIFRFYVVIEPDEVLPFVEVAVAMETRRFWDWKRRLRK